MLISPSFMVKILKETVGTKTQSNQRNNFIYPVYFICKY